MRRAGRKAKIPGYYIPTARSDQCAENYMFIYNGYIDYAPSDSICDMKAKKRESGEIKKCRPYYGDTRRKHSGRDYGGDGIGGVMKAV